MNPVRLSLRLNPLMVGRFEHFPAILHKSPSVSNSRRRQLFGGDAEHAAAHSHAAHPHASHATHASAHHAYAHAAHHSHSHAAHHAASSAPAAAAGHDRNHEVGDGVHAGAHAF